MGSFLESEMRRPTPAEREHLVARIDAYLEAFSGSTYVPDKDRHRIKRPMLSGSPEPIQKLLADIREALR